MAGIQFKITRFYFQIKYCVETKTTTLEDSTHHINNLNQVDPIDEHGGGTTLLGKCWVIEDEEGTDIPSLMDSLLEEIGDEEKLKEDLISKCSKYGIFNIGYDHEHEEMRS